MSEMRRATESDRARLLDYLKAEPEVNLFIVGDILNFGFDTETVEYHIQESAGRIEAVVMRYRVNLIPYTRDVAADLQPLAAQMAAWLKSGTAKMVSGKKEIVGRLSEYLPPSKPREMFLCVCRRAQAGVPLGALPLVTMAQPGDAAEIVALVRSIPDFGGSPMLPEDLAHEIAEGKNRVAVVRDPTTGRMVSSASAVAETGEAAMIVMVCTDARHRRRGYASACTYRLVSDLNVRGKSACLFFHNPAAGAIYHRLGFADIGFWEMLKFP